MLFSVQALGFVFRLCGKTDAELFKYAHIGLGEDDRSVRVGVAKLRQALHGDLRGGIGDRGHSQRYEYLVGMQPRIVGAEGLDLELLYRLDDRSVEYDVTELDELVLAYATTVHKAQGAEYPIVVMPVMMTHFVMLQRNLLYTGVTRAKKALMIVGTKKAIACCVRSQTVDRRNTLLAERLQGKTDSSTGEKQPEAE